MTEDKRDIPDIFGLETVNSLPLLYDPEEDLIIISDLHLGLEGSMTSKGSYVPQFQLEDILDDIKEAKNYTGADSILINGDLKNEFNRSHYAEKKEIRELLEFLKSNFREISLIKGNHDTMLDGLMEGFNLQLENYIVENGFLYTHGHIALDNLDIKEEFDTIVIGHEHPALALKDDVGIKEKIDCFLYGSTDDGKNIVVLPASAKVSNGTDINEIPKRQLLSPILRDDVSISKLKALGVSREAGLFPFPELKKLKKR